MKTSQTRDINNLNLLLILPIKDFDYKKLTFKLKRSKRKTNFELPAKLILIHLYGLSHFKYKQDKYTMDPG